ncbi:MAG: hypothetical protein IJ607_04665 [Bacteroidaceae bacterium]|nr:hypothetical protein [Bacteroidaceae bacterium]
MKKLLLMTMFLAATLTMNALPIDEAQREALFLTDKMAYELDLTEEQYELAYEVNLDYLLSINYHGDLYGTWWSRRNADLRYILSDYQYRIYVGLNYFYRPLAWRGGRWYYPIYGRYADRYHFYRARPHGFGVYRGGHNRIHGHYNRPIHRPHAGRIGNHPGGHPGGHYGGHPGGHPGGHVGGNHPGGNYNNRNYNGGGNRPGGNYNGNHNDNRNYNGGGNNRNYNGGGHRPGNIRSQQNRSNSSGRVAAPGRRR